MRVQHFHEPHSQVMVNTSRQGKQLWLTTWHGVVGLFQGLTEPPKLAVSTVDVLSRKQHLVQGVQVILAERASSAVQPPPAHALQVEAVHARK